MMMPEARCPAGAHPGKSVKSGNSDSATFMRNVSDPQRQFSIRRPQTFGQGTRLNEMEVEKPGINPRGDGCGTEGFTLVRLNADGLPILDKDSAHPRR